MLLLLTNLTGAGMLLCFSLLGSLDPVLLFSSSRDPCNSKSALPLSTVCLSQSQGYDFQQSAPIALPCCIDV